MVPVTILPILTRSSPAEAMATQIILHDREVTNILGFIAL